MKAWAALGLVVALDTFLCVFWLGPYWFIFLGAIFCGMYLVVSMCQVAGRADDRIHDMFDYHVEQDDEGRDVLVTVPKRGRDEAA